MNRLGPYLLGPNDENQGIYTGDAKILAKEIPDESVDLIFTDPVYDRIEDYEWLAKTAARILKPRGHLIAFYQTNLARQTANAIYGGGMDTSWVLSTYLRGGPSRRLAIGHTKQRLAWLCLKQGTSMWQHRLVDVLESITVPKGKKLHAWQKDGKAIIKWVNWLTGANDITLDPFCGGGTISTACKKLGRPWLAFEIDPNIAELARQQVAQAQPPLFVPEPQQLELSV